MRRVAVLLIYSINGINQRFLSSHFSRSRRMHILVINCGSTTVKLRLIDSRQDVVVLDGQADLEQQPARLALQFAGQNISLELTENSSAAALEQLARWWQTHAFALPVDAIAHRMVHGGARYHEPLAVTVDNVEALQALTELAPLHHPPALAAIAAAQLSFAHLPHYVLFDTAYYRHLPEQALTYAVPESWRTLHGVRRYGFHGWSHRHAVRAAATLLQRKPAELRVISIHLGGGASVTASRLGLAVDTSMGMTPTAGLPMATRCGDIDPMIPLHMQQAGLSAAEVDHALNHASGLLGLCGSEDMRTVLLRAEQCEPAACLALDVYCYAIRKYVGAYLVALGGADAIVFTAGVGEHSPEIRRRVLGGLEELGIVLDAEQNRTTSGDHAVHHRSSRIAVLTVHSEEEIEMAHSLSHFLQGETACPQPT